VELLDAVMVMNEKYPRVAHAYRASQQGWGDVHRCVAVRIPRRVDDLSRMPRRWYCANMLVEDAVYRHGKRIGGALDLANGLLEIPDGNGSIPNSNGSIPNSTFEWVGFVDPTEAEIAGCARRFGVDPLAVEDALSRTQRAKLDRYATHTSLLVKTIAYNVNRSRIDVGDVTLIFAEHFILTVRHGAVLPLREVRIDLEQHPERMAQGPGVVVHEILDRLVDEYVHAVDALHRDLIELEDAAFRDTTEIPTGRAYLIKREVLECRRAAAPLVDALLTLMEGEVQGIPKSFAPRLKDVYDHLRRVVDDVERMNELVDAALAACLNIAQVRQNSDMRRISAWVGLAAVPTMVAGIYGMNFSYMPELQVRWAYFLVMGGTAAFSVGLFVYFRRRRWL
jgi:magnesium transporter